MRKTLGFILALLFIVSACQHQETAVRHPESEAAPKKRGVTFLFSSNRQLEIEPCGCSLNPLGGIDRELNFLTSVKSGADHPVLNFSAGTTFVPEVADYQPKSFGFYQKKATYVVKGMNTLELQAAAPSADDFKLGVEYLKQLEAQSKFPWVLANVVDKKTKEPIFKRSHSFKVGDDEYLVVGLTRQPEKAYANKQIQVLPAAEVLREILSQVKTKKFVVVLSNLSKAEWRTMGELTGKIQLILGSTEADSTGLSWEQWNTGTLFVNPSNRGKYAARLDLSWVEPIVGFYAASFAEANAFSRRAVKLAQVESKIMLEKKLSPKEKKYWTDKAAMATARMEFLPNLPTELAPGLAEANATIVELGASFKEPQNASSEILAQWQTEMRSLAIKKN